MINSDGWCLKNKVLGIVLIGKGLLHSIKDPQAVSKFESAPGKYKSFKYPTQLEIRSVTTKIKSTLQSRGSLNLLPEIIFGASPCSMLQSGPRESADHLPFNAASRR
jgi:hypothetical protein